MAAIIKLDFCRLAALTAWHCCAFAAAPLIAADDEFSRSAAPLFKQFCYECHAGQEPEAGLNLERMSAERSFAADFKHWRNVAALVAEKKMPPADMPQPSEAERRTLVSLVRGEVSQAAAKDAGDPGAVIIRRLTSAEYAYTIRDLTGLDLKLDRDFVSDAVGGEGFTNIGTVQFVQDSTLERYLSAARQVASHAVIGAGPLDFFRDPGKTGYELSAINRIQEIYRLHGIRTAAGEGAIPFGLDRYPKAFFAAWKYQHREQLGLGEVSLARLAAEAGQNAQFVEHVWSVLTNGSFSFPTSEIVARWRQLPVPDGTAERMEKTRTECDEVYRFLTDWQSRLARSIGDEEEAAVLSEDSLNVVKSKTFTARFFFPEGAKTARLQFSIALADPNKQASPVVVWRNPRLRFRSYLRRREEPQSLRTVLPAESAAEFAFGVHPRGGEIGENDFVTVGAIARPLDLTIPANARGVELLVDTELDLVRGEDCVARSELTGGGLDGTTRTVSALLADPAGAALQSWKAGVLDLARLLPQVSHREPAPSDRDPIPAPFDNAYNMRERDYFHYKVKYHRDDKFLVEKLLDDATRRRLDEAWADLLASFEYHDAWLRFLAGKFEIDLGGKGIADLDRGWIEQLPAEPKVYVQNLRDSYARMQQSLAAGRPRHVDDVLQFASHAWRRPLAAEEQQRLRAFCSRLREHDELAHAEAIRALLVRVLVAPEFLYRAERPAESAVATPLSDYELASRLSFFLWSSLPDEELSRAAAAGELREPEQLAQQARRMLADPKARRLATEFFGQWFGFYQFDRYRGVDPQRFPEFTDQLRTALHEESIAFFEHIIRADRPASEILFADYAFLNADTAKHYGIASDVTEGPPRKVDQVGGANRGGLLGLGAVLTVTSAPLRTSAVKRGDWVLRRVLGTAVPPPPADAGSIPADDVLGDGKTVRARLEAHRHNATCANCHARIDPFGFALEHYDPLGRWRERYKDGERIDASGTLSDGTTISGKDGLRQYLKDNQPRFHRTLSLKLLGYALGRGELVSDEKLIEEMLASLAGGGRFSELVVKIVTSRQFCYHRGQALAQVPAAAEGP